MQWIWKPFAELTPLELYQAIQLREQVFTVEQNCVYLDCDGQDPLAYHLLGFRHDRLVAYLRAFRPGVKFADASIGRVVASAEVRRGGFGKALMQYGLERVSAEFGNPAIRISAQSYLQKFYEGFGFRKTGREYLEDGIPHLEMVRAPQP